MTKFKLKSKDKEVLFEADISYKNLKEMFDNGVEINEDTDNAEEANDG